MSDMGFVDDPIAAGHRIDQFLKDEAVQAALAAMKETNYRLFLGATSDETRMVAQAQQIVLESFEQTLRGAIDQGEHARQVREKRDRAPDTR